MVVFKCSRKVQKFGSSMAITIPALFVKINKIKKGSNVEIHYNTNGIMIICIQNSQENKNLLTQLK